MKKNKNEIVRLRNEIFTFKILCLKMSRDDHTIPKKSTILPIPQKALVTGTRRNYKTLRTLEYE